MYAFALCAYFILHGEPLFDENNELAYDNNTAKNEKGNETWELLKAAINSCLQDNPDDRPDFTALEGEAFLFLLEGLCQEQSEQADEKAVALIEEYGNEELLNYPEMTMKQTCLMDASRLNRPAITKALLAKGANPNLVETLEGSTALHMAMYKDGQMEVCKLLVENGVEINV